MAVSDPYDAEVVEDAIRTWVVNALDDVIPEERIIWSHPNAYRPYDNPGEGYPFAVITHQTSSPENGGHSAGVRWTFQSHIWTVTIVSTAAGSYTATVKDNENDTSPEVYTYVSPGGETVTDIRDALLALMVGSSLANFASSGSDAITVTGVTVGEGITVTAGDAKLTSAETQKPILYEAHQTYTLTYSIDVFTETFADPTVQAYPIASRLKGSLALPSVTGLMYASNIAYRRSGAVIDVSTLQGTEFDRRAQFDCTFAIEGVITEEVTTIETVQTTNNITGA